MEKIKVIALFGKSGSGKDTIQKNLIQRLKNANGIVSCTTRPMRQNEIDGVDYHFLSTVDFTKKLINGDILEATEFNRWFYGTPIDSLKEDKINIGVFNPQGINKLILDERIEVVPIYIYADEKIRLLRQLTREQKPDCKEICRRYMTDEEDFKEEKYNFNYLVYDNSGELDIYKVIKLIEDNSN